MWTEGEIRDLIEIEVSTGQMMRVLNSAITSGELVVIQIATAAYLGFESQTARVTLMAAEMEATRATIDGILSDCRAFVQQTQVESNAAKLAMTSEVDALHTKLQDIVKLVEGVPDTVSSLNARLVAITTWLEANPLENAAASLTHLQENHETLQANTGRRH